MASPTPPERTPALVAFRQIKVGFDRKGRDRGACIEAGTW